MLTLNIQKVCKGKDALTGKEGDGVLVTLASGKPRFFIWKSLQQFIGMELEAHPEAPAAQPIPATAQTAKPNGPPQVAQPAAK